MIDLREHAARGELRIGEQVGGAVDVAEQDVLLQQQRLPLGGGAGRHHRVDQAVELAEAVAALDGVGQLRIVGQVDAPDQPQEAQPLRGGVGYDAEPAVGGAERAAIGVDDAGVAGLPLVGYEALAGHVLGHGEGDHGLEHRHLDRLALAGAQAVDDGGEHGVDDGEPGRLVGDDVGDELFLAGHRALEPGDAAHRLDGVVHRRAAGVRAALGIAVGGAIDDIGADRADAVIVESELGGGGGTQRQHHHVAGREQAFERALAGPGLEVERDRALVAVELEKGVAHARRSLRHDVAEHVAVGRLQLDDVGPHVAQRLRRQRPHAERRQVEDANPVQRLRGCFGRVRHPRAASSSGRGDGSWRSRRPSG